MSPMTSTNLTKRALIEILTKRVVTIQDFAAFLKCSVRSIHTYKAAGTIPAPDIREHGFVRWFPRTIEQWQKSKAKKL